MTAPITLHKFDYANFENRSSVVSLNVRSKDEVDIFLRVLKQIQEKADLDLSPLPLKFRNYVLEVQTFSGQPNYQERLERVFIEALFYPFINSPARVFTSDIVELSTNAFGRLRVAFDSTPGVDLEPGDDYPKDPQEILAELVRDPRRIRYLDEELLLDYALINTLPEALKAVCLQYPNALSKLVDQNLSEEKRSNVEKRRKHLSRLLEEIKTFDDPKLLEDLLKDPQRVILCRKNGYSLDKLKGPLAKGMTLQDLSRKLECFGKSKFQSKLAKLRNKIGDEELLDLEFGLFKSMAERPDLILFLLEEHFYLSEINYQRIKNLTKLVDPDSHALTLGDLQILGRDYYEQLLDHKYLSIIVKNFGSKLLVLKPWELSRILEYSSDINAAFMFGMSFEQIRAILPLKNFEFCLANSPQVSALLDCGFRASQLSENLINNARIAIRYRKIGVSCADLVEIARMKKFNVLSRDSIENLVRVGAPVLEAAKLKGFLAVDINGIAEHYKDLQSVLNLGVSLRAVAEAFSHLFSTGMEQNTHSNFVSWLKLNPLFVHQLVLWGGEDILSSLTNDFVFMDKKEIRKVSDAIRDGLSWEWVKPCYRSEFAKDEKNGSEWRCTFSSISLIKLARIIPILQKEGVTLDKFKANRDIVSDLAENEKGFAELRQAGVTFDTFCKLGEQNLGTALIYSKGCKVLLESGVDLVALFKEFGSNTGYVLSHPESYLRLKKEGFDFSSVKKDSRKLFQLLTEEPEETGFLSYLYSLGEWLAWPFKALYSALFV